jgi:hypothetical protein
MVNEYETAFVWVKGERSGTAYFRLNQRVPETKEEIEGVTG